MDSQDKKGIQASGHYNVYESLHFLRIYHNFASVFNCKSNKISVLKVRPCINAELMDALRFCLVSYYFMVLS